MQKNRVNDAARDWLANALQQSGKKQNELAEALGLSPSAITRMLKGERQISLTELDEAMRFFGEKESAFIWLMKSFPIYELLEGPEQTLQAAKEAFTGDKPATAYVDPVQIPDDGVVEVDLEVRLPSHTRLSSEAFFPVIYRSDVIKCVWSIPNHAIQRFGVKDRRTIRCFEHHGDSMAPILNDGDIAFVDCNIKNFSSPGIYAISDFIAGAIVRRLDIASSPLSNPALIRVSSENSRYEERIVPYVDVTVLGRYVGAFSRSG